MQDVTTTGNRYSNVSFSGELHSARVTQPWSTSAPAPIDATRRHREASGRRSRRRSAADRCSIVGDDVPMDDTVRSYVDAIAAEHRSLFDRIKRLVLEAYPDAEIV